MSPKRKTAVCGTTSMYAKGCRCDACYQALRDYKNAYYRENAHKVREYEIQRKYGVTSEAYEDRLFVQNGLCAICSRPMGEKYFDVDHDHNTLKIRGLLCRNCNRNLGWYEGVRAQLHRYLLEAKYGKSKG